MSSRYRGWLRNHSYSVFYGTYLVSGARYLFVVSQVVFDNGSSVLGVIGLGPDGGVVYNASLEYTVIPFYDVLSRVIGVVELNGSFYIGLVGGLDGRDSGLDVFIDPLSNNSFSVPVASTSPGGAVVGNGVSVYSNIIVYPRVVNGSFGFVAYDLVGGGYWFLEAYRGYVWDTVYHVSAANNTMYIEYYAGSTDLSLHGAITVRLDRTLYSPTGEHVFLPVLLLASALLAAAYRVMGARRRGQ